MLQIFKNKFFVILLITIILLISIGVSSKSDSKVSAVFNQAGTLLSPFQHFFSFSGSKAESFFTYFKDMNALKKENADLKAKVDQLQDENIKLQQFEQKNKELIEVLNIKNQLNNYETIGANIISKDPGNWFDVFKIDRGSRDGVGNNYPVIASKGLVGVIISTDMVSSKVLTIIDSDSIISARLSKSREMVRIKGDISLKDQGLCMMDHIPLEADISVGDFIETSGMGGIYPKGITIGKVKEIVKTASDLNRYAIVEPVVDFKRLEEVLVMKGINNNLAGAGSTEK